MAPRKKRKVSKTEDDGDEGDYEVEKIAEHSWYGEDMFKWKLFYKLKWKGYDDRDNTWQSEQDTTGCQELIEEYWKRNRECFTYENTFGNEREHFGEGVDDKNEMRRSLSRSLARRCLNEKFVAAISSSSKGESGNEKGGMRKRKAPLELEMGDMEEGPDGNLDCLKMWEIELNKLCQRHGEAPLVVENDVDFDEPPSGFGYVCDYVPMEGIEIDDEPIIFCGCEDNCLDKKHCCPAQNEQEPVYTVDGRLTLKHRNTRMPIYECNRKCSCTFQTCTNRLVQKGRKFKLKIVKTKKKGWGVVAEEKIKVGSFVTSYVGELITLNEAERRSQICVKSTTSYLFDLDMDGDPQGGCERE